jgi:hypothetical protein
MTTTTTAELAAVSGTDIATLPPAARAAVALKSEQTRKELALLVAQSADILAVTNADGREQAHRVGMTLKGARVAIEKTGKEARDDATKFSKAVIAEEKELIAIIEPEEARILALRDAWDEQIAAEKAAKIAAERARTDAIQARIQAIRNTPLTVAGKTSAEILVARDAVRDTLITEELFGEQEFRALAMEARSDAFNALEAAFDMTEKAEAAALAAEQARLAEIARIEAEREELAQLRAVAAETARLAKIETDRIAAEQAAEAIRLDEQRHQQEVELQRQRDAEAARVAAEQAERDRVAAETKRQLDAQQAEIAAQRAAFVREQEEARARIEAAVLLERDHTEALPMNAQFDIDREADRVRLQACADESVANARERANDERKAGLPAGSLHALIDDLDELDPTDDEITAMGAECGLTPGEWVIRLSKYVAARELVAA